MAKVKIGGKAPAFTLFSDQGKKVSLSDYRGQKVVLYFYPRDNTPGCTRESCGFRDGLSEIKSKGSVVLGVSTDSVASHKGFKQKYALNFPLLSDPEKKMSLAYGVWKQKSLYGRKYMGLDRTTFLINEEGKISKVFPKVQVDGHLDEVLAALGDSS
jgi:peroxiredoxin Q/BCP